MKTGIVIDDVVQLGELEVEELEAQMYLTRSRLNELAIVVAKKGEIVHYNEKYEAWMTRDKLAVPAKFIRVQNSNLSAADVNKILH